MSIHRKQNTRRQTSGKATHQQKIEAIHISFGGRNNGWNYDRIHSNYYYLMSQIKNNNKLNQENEMNMLSNTFIMDYLFYGCWMFVVSV